MAFKKGISGNPTGRPPGATNKTTKELRDLISNFLIQNFEQVVKDFKKLQPKDRTRLYCDLLQYGLPKLQTVNSQFDFDNLTDKEIEEIISELKNAANSNIPHIIFPGDNENE